MILVILELFLMLECRSRVIKWKSIENSLIILELLLMLECWIYRWGHIASLFFSLSKGNCPVFHLIRISDILIGV